MDTMVVKLTKTYGPTWPWQAPATVLSDVSFSVGFGEIFGFLGPNRGRENFHHDEDHPRSQCKRPLDTVELLGAPWTKSASPKRIGYLPESPYCYDYLTAEEFLMFYGGLAGLARRA